MLSYGASTLVRKVTRDLFSDHLEIYPAEEVYAIMSMATLKVIKAAVTLGRMSPHYKRIFVCRDYPGAAMSKNSLGNLLQRLGQDGARRRQFYQLRLSAAAADHHIAIDGTLNKITVL